MIVQHIGEALLSLIFLLGGGTTLLHPEGQIAQVSRLHFPLPQIAVRVNALAMIVAGLFLAVGAWAQIAAWVLIVVLIPTTIFGHPFWLEQGDWRPAQLSHFIKNLTIIGGLLLVTQIAR